MRRYPAFDPPEYQNWEPDLDLVREFVETVLSDRATADIVKGMKEETHLWLYRSLLVARLHDTSLKRWVRQGVISKAWLGTGEEAVTVGSVAALDPARDVITPMIRNAGACWMMGMPLADLFRSYLGIYPRGSCNRSATWEPMCP